MKSVVFAFVMLMFSSVCYADVNTTMDANDKYDIFDVTGKLVASNIYNPYTLEVIDGTIITRGYICCNDNSDCNLTQFDDGKVYIFKKSN